MEETPETLQIEQLVADTRHRIRRNRIVTGLLLGLALTFGWLLIGRWRYGWRGRTALRWTVSGFVALMLAYPGSRFVLEVLLHRA
jgi:ABC-type uncharacterized transport system permease subunit